ncbi:VF530 family protein [uncultured Amphritea sp.]|uniref:VF530 family protein n=1 Tax=uncultured Amphritea sp. TaxID=981605 RepID=UPI002609E7AF|nr:VF530 family protein [uncultured Amphritea sp.]
MTGEQKNNPLHGVTLQQIVTDLEAEFGWEELGRRISIRCFQSDPSIKSSLKFLRKTPWAREKVEQLWVLMQERKTIWNRPQS